MDPTELTRQPAITLPTILMVQDPTMLPMLPMDPMGPIVPTQRRSIMEGRVGVTIRTLPTLRTTPTALTLASSPMDPTQRTGLRMDPTMLAMDPTLPTIPTKTRIGLGRDTMEGTMEQALPVLAPTILPMDPTPPMELTRVVLRTQQTLPTMDLTAPTPQTQRDTPEEKEGNTPRTLPFKPLGYKTSSRT